MIWGLHSFLQPTDSGKNLNSVHARFKSFPVSVIKLFYALKKPLNLIGFGAFLFFPFKISSFHPLMDTLWIQSNRSSVNGVQYYGLFIAMN
jgi:hypothetical protein